MSSEAEEMSVRFGVGFSFFFRIFFFVKILVLEMIFAKFCFVLSSSFFGFFFFFRFHFAWTFSLFDLVVAEVPGQVSRSLLLLVSRLSVRVKIRPLMFPHLPPPLRPRKCAE